MIDLFIIWFDGYTYYVCTCVCTIARRPEVIAQTPGGALSQGASRQLLADRRKRRQQRRQHRCRSHPQYSYAQSTAAECLAALVNNHAYTHTHSHAHTKQ